MSKNFVDQMVTHMKLAGIVAKATPWMVEGIRDEEKNVRYIGLTLKDDWLDIFPPGNNLLLKFVIDKKSARLEFYVANKPPFFRFATKHFTDLDKWEILLGGMKQQLKKDKTDVQTHSEKAGNLYESLKPHLK